jgi:Fe2+ or Zn2+ uptake regulation protein
MLALPANLHRQEQFHVSPADPKHLLICAWCGRWKDPHDPSLWHPAETLMADASAVSHGMCPDCRQKLSNRKGTSHRGDGDGDARR